jgi:hypothetical protein
MLLMALIFSGGSAGWKAMLSVLSTPMDGVKMTVGACAGGNGG